MTKKHSLATTLVHAGRNKRVSQGSVNPVIQRASSLVFDNLAIVQTARYSTDGAAH